MTRAEALALVDWWEAQHGEPASAREVASCVGLGSPAVSGVLERARLRGLLRSSKCWDDRNRRVRGYELTDEGRRWLEWDAAGRPRAPVECPHCGESFDLE